MSGAVFGTPQRPKCLLPESPCLAPSRQPILRAFRLGRPSCIPSLTIERFEQEVLYGHGPAQVGFDVRDHLLSHLTVYRLSPEPWRLTRPVGARSCGPLTPAAEFKLPPVISDTGRDDDPIDGLFDRIEMAADEDVNGSGDYARTVVATTPQGRPPEQTSFRVAAAPRGGRTITDAYRYSVCDTKTDYALGLATDPQEPSSESSDFKMNHRSVAAVESKPSTSWGSLTPGSV